jgi:hypothetical protein
LFSLSVFHITMALPKSEKSAYDVVVLGAGGELVQCTQSDVELTPSFDRRPPLGV